MKMKGFECLFCLTLFFSIILLSDASRPTTKVFKSIKSEDGDVIDCIDILRQPAFDHPSLKNHTIKMKPSYHPEGGPFGEEKTTNFNPEGTTRKAPITQLWQLSGDCPKGTIPVRKPAGNQEFLGASSIRKKHRINVSDQKPYSKGQNIQGLFHEYAYSSVNTMGGQYYGTKATISVWQPYVEGGNEFSLSQLWILGGDYQNRNTIEVGWIVFPRLLGDNRTRLFIYWTSDGYRSTGCYNLGCSGFVQTNNEILIGGTISSSAITLLVWKDENQGVWWLKYDDTVVGYWPNSIFNSLRGSASMVEWGGEIINSNTNNVHTATQMGSGSFGQAGPGKASYFKNLQVVDNQNTLAEPASVATYASDQNCYSIIAGKDRYSGNFFYYGGPGRNPSCP